MSMVLSIKIDFLLLPALAHGDTFYVNSVHRCMIRVTLVLTYLQLHRSGKYGLGGRPTA